jgi:hypothetical protein
VGALSGYTHTQLRVLWLQLSCYIGNSRLNKLGLFLLIRDHDVFLLPERRKTLWRYMDFTKFVSLLEDRALVFPRTDQFEDPYEGYLPEAAVKVLRTQHTDFQMSLDQAECWIKFPETLRKQLYVSCWCASEYESAAMWKLFLSGAEGIAIRSNTDALTEALDTCMYTVGMSSVQYIDYETTSIPLGNALFPVMHKRLNFKHEQEYRAVIWSQITDNEPLIDKEAMTVSVPVDPGRLIEAIHVSPSAPRWFEKLVEKMVIKYGVAALVVRSNLYRGPTY